MKRGQVSIFVIIAIAIVVVIAAVFLFPRIQVLVTDVQPNSYLKNCIEDDALETMQLLASQGGYFAPDNTVMYQGLDYTYLCYTSENYKPCLVQQPLIRKNLEDNLKAEIEPKARQCVQDLKEAYESRGYTVRAAPGELNVSFIPGSLVLDFISPITVEKEGVQSFQKFTTSIDTEMYDLLLTATSVIELESSLGDADTTLYIQYYPDLKIEKIKRDGSTLYRLTNVVTEDEFSFASRSLVWPAGYGLEEL